jgi:hypothetical protein
VEDFHLLHLAGFYRRYLQNCLVFDFLLVHQFSARLSRDQTNAWLQLFKAFSKNGGGRVDIDTPFRVLTTRVA